MAAASSGSRLRPGILKFVLAAAQFAFSSNFIPAVHVVKAGGASAAPAVAAAAAIVGATAALSRSAASGIVRLIPSIMLVGFFLC